MRTKVETEHKNDIDSQIFKQLKKKTLQFDIQNDF